MMLLDNWMAMSLLAASAWAASCVLDVCFVSQGIYRRPWDGPTIAGIFCLVPVLLVPATTTLDFSSPPTVLFVAFLSGLVFIAHVYFYFKALFLLNDAVNAEIVNNLCVLIVPVLAFFLLGERLGLLHYLSIVIGAGAVILLMTSQTLRLPHQVVLYLGVSVSAISLMMVMQAWVLQHLDYPTTIWAFCCAAFASVALSLATRPRQAKSLVLTAKNFGLVFVGVQLLELGGTLGSQRATDIGPSVSLVALLECAVPVLIMMFSWGVVAGVRLIHGRIGQSLIPILLQQTRFAPSKITAVCLIVLAIALVQFDQ